MHKNQSILKIGIIMNNLSDLLHSSNHQGENASAFQQHPGYTRMFAEGKLTLGIFLPLRFYQGDMSVLKGQSELVKHIDELGFAAAWVRDVPLYDPNFGDAGQLFDPFTYLSYLAAKTHNIALVTGSAIFSLRHPIDLAKAATTIDYLSGGRGSSRQSMEWLGQYADGWLTFPESTHNQAGIQRLSQKISAWRKCIPNQGFRPHATNEWIDLVEDVNYPRTPIQGGYVLRTGRKGLIELLTQWQKVGVNHAALGIQFSKRPALEIIQELAEYVLPIFPSLEGSPTHPQHW